MPQGLPKTMGVGGFKQDTEAQDSGSGIGAQDFPFMSLGYVTADLRADVSPGDTMIPVSHLSSV